MTGKFEYAETILSEQGHDSEGIDAIDPYGDGDLDFVFVSEDNNEDELHLNNGKVVFSDASHIYTSYADLWCIS